MNRFCAWPSRWIVWPASVRGGFSASVQWRAASIAQQRSRRGPITQAEFTAPPLNPVVTYRSAAHVSEIAQIICGFNSR